MNIKITGSGSYIPTEVVTNKDFSNNIFLNEDGTPFPLPNEVITEKFYGITGIEERRYASDDLLTSNISIDIFFEDDNILVINKPYNIEVTGNNSLTTYVHQKYSKRF